MYQAGFLFLSLHKGLLWWSTVKTQRQSSVITRLTPHINNLRSAMKMVKLIMLEDMLTTRRFCAAGSVFFFQFRTLCSFKGMLSHPQRNAQSLYKPSDVLKVVMS